MNTPLIERARNLFEFLKQAQNLKTTSPLTTEAYERDGTVLWLADSPEHAAVTSAHRGGDPGPDDPLLTVDRVPRTDPPAPDAELARWLTEPLNDPERPPSLRDAITEVSNGDDAVEDQGAADQADHVTRTRRLANAPEIYELVAGVGCLAWEPHGYRCVTTSPWPDAATPSSPTTPPP